MFTQLYTFALMEIGTYVYHRGIHKYKVNIHLEHHRNMSLIINDDILSALAALLNLSAWKCIFPSFLCTSTYILYFFLITLGHHVNHSNKLKFCTHYAFSIILRNVVDYLDFLDVFFF